jgi:transmembrane sensor
MRRTDPKSIARAEAAVWLARLRSDEATSADEGAFRVWLDQASENRAAFDLASTAFEMLGPDLQPRKPSWRDQAAARWAVAGLAAAAVASGIVLVWAAPFRPTTQEFQTGFGEQRRIALEDGSLVMLDTSTAIRVSMSRHRRAIELIHGRGHFEVAKDESRPFVVKVADKQVIAVGTVFDVDRENGTTSVLLTRGKVLVENASDRRLLSPGDRLAFNHGQVVADRPDLDVLTGWQNGQAIFKRRPLRDVVQELNRYSRRQLELPDASMGDVVVSGSYRTGDNEAFAAALAAMLPVDVDTEPDRIVINLRKSERADGGGI